MAVCCCRASGGWWGEAVGKDLCQDGRGGAGGANVGDGLSGNSMMQGAVKVSRV